jgi:hypothetical protein
VTSPSIDRQGSCSTWTTEALGRIGRAEELQLATRRTDGTLRPFTTMWVVRSDGELYVRSAGGPQRPWFSHARAAQNGRIRAGSAEVDVRFTDAAPDAQTAIDAAYHAKYDRYGATIVGHVTGPDAYPGTIRLVPDEEKGNPT